MVDLIISRGIEKLLDSPRGVCLMWAEWTPPDGPDNFSHPFSHGVWVSLMSRTLGHTPL